MPGFFERRRQTKEIEREVKFKQGLSRVRNYVQKCNQAQKRYWELGKRALKLGDRQQFENIVKAYLRTGEMVNRWERYSVAMETISLQRDQVKATGTFAESMKALSASMMAGAKPEDITKMQIDLEQALTRAETLDETLSAIMDSTSDTIFSAEGLSEESLQEVEAAMKGEAAHEEGQALDDRIAAGLRRIEEEMRKEMK
ncbi:hypothetical protein M1N22_02560 [Dehalococcoidia bacterium]|nr:hypothetical protein [Dehalococcoidia bacterium]MCL0050714.1 hypothetical protein [Dehalococcoidia bacterium]MCL0059622.1 hypothetical protein [Dehalococcoidia bacterium]MCL0093618.1 hypothetical protein [Dehalococcoidia bacterium]MCL0097422.1 hypothetical protein [Dehalococcoidia bacterium]